MVESSQQVPRNEGLKHWPSPADIARRIAGRCIQHPALALSFGYLYVSAIGMLYTSKLFSAFGISMLDFAETTDFLLAALRRPVALLLSAFTTVVWLGYLLGVYAFMSVLMGAAWIPRSFGRGYERWQRALACQGRFHLLFATTLALIAWFGTALYGLSLFADSEAKRLADCPCQLLVVELKNSDSAGLPTIIEEDLVLVGRAGSFAFFYDLVEQRTQVIPTANILRMYAMPPKPLATPTSTTETLGVGTTQCQYCRGEL